MSHRSSLLAFALLVTPILAHAQDRKADAPRPPAARPAATPDRDRPAQRPDGPAATRPAAAGQQTARCNDGTMWSGASRQGACANHGGVKEWGGAERHDWAAGVMAHCGDGTDYTGTSRQGACASHGGVKKWRVDDDDENGRPRDAKARCNDGTWWTSDTRQGACSSHGGVHHWLRGRSAEARSH